MKITTRASYTIRALLDLARHSPDGRPVRLLDISSREGISHAYLEQLFNQLKRIHVVNSRKGPGGGYTLGMEPKDILIGEVITAVEGETNMFLCSSDVSAGEICWRYSQCATHGLWDNLAVCVHDFLNSISLADLLADVEEFKKHENTEYA